MKRVSLPLNLNSLLQATGQGVHVVADWMPHMLYNQLILRLRRLSRQRLQWQLFGDPVRVKQNVQVDTRW